MANRPKRDSAMRKLFSAIAIGLALSVAACATMESGTDFNMVAAESFVAGKTTRSDIEAALGKPYSVTEHSDGSSMIIYVHMLAKGNSLSGRSTAESKSVAYLFDSQGVLKQKSVQQGGAQSR